MKKLASLMLSAALLATLAACGGNGGAASNGASGSPAPDAAESTPEGGAASGEVKELTFWYQDNAVMVPAINQRVDAFNEEYSGEYHLSVEFIPRGTAYAYEDKVNTAAAASTLPDILSTDGPNISNYAANGILLPLDEYITDESKADMMPSMVIQNTYLDKMYAVGINESSCALFYNKDIFEQHGYRVPTGIEDAYTWDELYAMAAEIATPEVAGIKLIMNKGEGIPYALSPFWNANGTALTSDDGSTMNGYVNSAEGVEAAAYLQKFFTEKLANIDPSPTEFNDGKAAMWITNSGELANLNENFPDLNWGVTYMPVSDGGVAASPCGSWAMGITKDCGDIDAAAVALNFLTSADSTAVYAEVGGYPPARRSNYDNNDLWVSEPYSVFAEQLFETAVPRPRTPIYTVLSPKFSETMLDIFSGADPQESLDSLAEYVDAEYARSVK